MRIRGSLAPLVRALPRGGGCALLTHARPEGDAIGSLLGLALGLEQRGVRALRLCADPVPVVYRFMSGSARVRRRLPKVLPETAIVVDCDGPARLGALGGALARFETVIDIDHHSGERAFGDIMWIDARAPAAAEMVYRLLKAMRVRITPQIAECLYAGIVTDTSRFTNPNTTAQTLAVSAELARRGADPVKIAARAYESRPVASSRLLGTALGRLAVRKGGRMVTAYLTREDFARAKARPEDTEGIVDHLRGIRGAQAAALFSAQAGGEVRVSLRSRGRVDVARVASAFGGGGHRGAAGCTVAGPVGAAMRRVARALSAAIGK